MANFCASGSELVFKLATRAKNVAICSFEELTDLIYLSIPLNTPEAPVTYAVVPLANCFVPSTYADKLVFNLPAPSSTDVIPLDKDFIPSAPFLIIHQHQHLFEK